MEARSDISACDIWYCVELCRNQVRNNIQYYLGDTFPHSCDNLKENWLVYFQLLIVIARHFLFLARMQFGLDSKLSRVGSKKTTQNIIFKCLKNSHILSQALVNFHHWRDGGGRAMAGGLIYGTAYSSMHTSLSMRW